jgi:hypothetical protein
MNQVGVKITGKKQENGPKWTGFSGIPAMVKN